MTVQKVYKAVKCDTRLARSDDYLSSLHEKTLALYDLGESLGFINENLSNVREKGHVVEECVRKLSSEGIIKVCEPDEIRYIRQKFDEICLKNLGIRHYNENKCILGKNTCVFGIDLKELKSEFGLPETLNYMEIGQTWNEFSSKFPDIFKDCPFVLDSNENESVNKHDLGQKIKSVVNQRYYTPLMEPIILQTTA